MEKPSWPAIRAAFEEGAVKYPSVSARWEPREGVWTFCDPSESGEGTNATGAAEDLFKATARNAFRLLGPSASDLPPWHLWLDRMRQAKRGFSRALAPKTWTQAKQLAELLSQGRTVNLSDVPLSESGSIAAVFSESAEFCKDLSIAAATAKHPRADTASGGLDLLDLSQAARYRIEAAEHDAAGVLADGQSDASQFVSQAHEMGVDPSGIGYSPGDVYLDLARRQAGQAKERAAGIHMEAVVREHLNVGNLDIEDFNAKLEVIGDWIFRKYRIDQTVLQQLKRHFKGIALRKQAASLEADDGPNETVIPTLPGRGLIADGEVAGSVSNQASPTARFLKRTDWLGNRLLERGWSNADPSKFGGPDRKTIEKILRGEAVRNDVLEKLVRALNAGKRDQAALTVLDIPQD